MEIRTFTQNLGASMAQGSGVPAVSPNVRQVLSDIASNTALSDGDRTAMVAAVAEAQGIKDSVVQAQILAQVQGLGVYVRHTNDEGFPRWNVMTTLRVYGLNLKQGQGGASDAVVAARVQQKLESVAQGRGVSVQQAVAVANAAQQAAEVQQAPAEGHRVEAVA